MAKNGKTEKTESSELAARPAIDIDFLNIQNPEDLIDLEEIEQPLREIKEFLGVPVVLRNPVKKIGTKGDKQFYYIFDVQDIQTGESWKSSCGHWFMEAYITRCEEKGLKPFPVALAFYQDGQSIKFKGVSRNRPQTPQQDEIPF